LIVSYRVTAIQRTGVNFTARLPSRPTSIRSDAPSRSCPLLASDAIDNTLKTDVVSTIFRARNQMAFARVPNTAILGEDVPLIPHFQRLQDLGARQDRQPAQGPTFNAEDWSKR